MPYSWGFQDSVIFSNFQIPLLYNIKGHATVNVCSCVDQFASSWTRKAACKGTVLYLRVKFRKTQYVLDSWQSQDSETLFRFAIFHFSVFSIKGMQNIETLTTCSWPDLCESTWAGLLLASGSTLKWYFANPKNVPESWASEDCDNFFYNCKIPLLCNYSYGAC